MLCIINIRYLHCLYLVLYYCVVVAITTPIIVDWSAMYSNVVNVEGVIIGYSIVNCNYMV